MRHPSDAVAQQTFLNADEVQFKREKARKSAPKVELPAVPDEECCWRCAHWDRPEEADGFGQCRQLAVIESAVPGRYQRGEVLHIAEAMQGGFPATALPTRGFFEGCSLYWEREGRETA